MNVELSPLERNQVLVGLESSLNEGLLDAEDFERVDKLITAIMNGKRDFTSEELWTIKEGCYSAVWSQSDEGYWEPCKKFAILWKELNPDSNADISWAYMEVKPKTKPKPKPKAAYTPGVRTAYIYEVSYSVAEFGEEKIVIEANSRQEADQRIDEWCKANYANHSESSSGLGPKPKFLSQSYLFKRD